MRVEPGQRQRQQDRPARGQGGALAGLERARAPRAHGRVHAERDQVEPAEHLGDRKDGGPALEHDTEPGHAGRDREHVGDEARQHDGQHLLAADPLAEQERVLRADGDDESETGEKTGESDLEHDTNATTGATFNPAKYYEESLGGLSMKDITQLDPVALRTLAVAVRLGTFEAAARELHVTPSAVSQRVKALETRIGRVLLHRVKPLEPTEAGLVLVRLATQTELLEREAVAELVEESDAGGTSYTSVPIAVNADALYGWFVDALAEVQSRHRVVFEVVREDHTRTAERLRRGEVMAAITGEPRPVPGCRVVRLGRLRYAAVATREFHGAHFADGVGSTTLAEAPIVAFDRSDSLQHDFVRRVTRRHLAPPVTYLPSVREFDRAIRVGMGWGLLPESDVAAELRAGRAGRARPGAATRGRPLLAALAPGVVAGGGAHRCRGVRRPALDGHLRRSSVLLTASRARPRLPDETERCARHARIRSEDPQCHVASTPRGPRPSPPVCSSRSAGAVGPAPPPPPRRPTS